MEIHTKEHIMREGLKDMANIIGQWEVFSKEPLKMGFEKGKEYGRVGLVTVINMRDSIKRIKSMVMESLFGVMEIYIKVNSKMI